MARVTAPEELEQLARVLDREAEQLDEVRRELREQVAATRGEWEGQVADRFRAHVGADHRQHHLAAAGRRLRVAARLARQMAAEQRAGG